MGINMSEGVWRVFDSLIKGLGASVISGLIMYYGYQAQQTRALLVQKTERVNAMVEFAANQKDLDVNLAMGMLEKFLVRYFEKDRSQPTKEVSQEDLLLLRLISLNFQDVPINLKPLFEELDQQLAAQKDKLTRIKLRETAMEVARRQAFRMTFLEGYDSGPRNVKSGDELELKNIRLKVVIGKTSKDSVEVTLDIADKRIGPFSVGYFDSPIVDNVKISRDLRLSVLLISSDDQNATVRIIAFQDDLASDRFDLKEMSREFVKQESHPQ